MSGFSNWVTACNFNYNCNCNHTIIASRLLMPISTYLTTTTFARLYAHAQVYEFALYEEFIHR